FSVGGAPSSAPISASNERKSAGETRRQAVSTEEYDVVVRAEGQFRRNKTDLQKMTVGSSNGGVISLDQVVRIEEGVGPSSIDRLNRRRQVTLSANVKPGGSQSQVIDQLNEIVKEMTIEPGY